MEEARERQRRLYRLARDQAGVVGRNQLLAAAIPPSTIESWLKSGRLIAGFRGAYSLGQPLNSNEAWWMAAVLAAGEGAALAGFSATKAQGFGRREGTIEVARPAGRNRRLVPQTKPGQVAEVRKSVLLPGDLGRIGAVPVMTVSRALLDIAGRSSPSELRQEFIEAGRHNFLTSAVLKECIDRGQGFRNHSRLVWLVEAWTSGSGRIRSYLEGDFRIFCFERKIPVPLSNVMVSGVEVDAFWPEQRLVVELDSRQFHGDGFAFENDRGKSNRLLVEGYVVIRITWKMLKEHPDEVESTIRKALGCN